MNDGSVVIHVKGSKPVLTDVAELLGWMTSAFQTAAGSVSSSLITFGQVPTVHSSTAHFRFSISGTESPRLSGACWLPLVRNSIIAFGFEIPARTGQKGLELSFDELVTICGIEYPINRDGRVIFLGLSTILVPTAIFDDCSIQWHVILAQDPSRLQRALHGLDSSLSIFHARYIRDFRYYTQDNYRMSDTGAPTFKGQTITGWPAFLSRLRGARHFLGWCKNVDIILGTAIGQYTSVSWTRAAESKTQKVPSADGFSLGTGGKGIFGASYSRSYTITQNRDQRFPFANRKAKYEDVLNNHKEEQIILYDPKERRAWLVPFLSVLLHVVILRLQRDGYTGPLPYADPTWDGAAAALKALLDNRSLPLLNEESHSSHSLYQLEDLTKLLIFALQNAYPTKASSTIRGKLIFGHELMDMVTCEPPFRIKKRSVKSSHGGWPRLTGDVQIVLFCRGIGEALRPSQSETNLCPSWQFLPKGLDYLGATIKGLKHLAERAGYCQSFEFLMEGYRWYCPRNSFIYECKRRTVGADDCTCEPLQRLQKRPAFAGSVLFPHFIRSAGASFTAPSDVILNGGAVIFGHSSHRIVRKLLKALCDTVNMSEDECKERPQSSHAELSGSSTDISGQAPFPNLHPRACPGRSVLVSGSGRVTPQEHIGFSRLLSNEPLRRWRDVPRMTSPSAVVSSLQRCSGEQLIAGIAPRLLSTTHWTILECIRSDRMSFLPVEGSNYDKALEWAQLFVERLHQFEVAIAEISEDSDLAVQLSYGYCTLLLEVMDEWTSNLRRTKLMLISI
jgi:hypothetical protein